MGYKIAKKETSHLEKDGFDVDYYIHQDKGLGFNSLIVDVHTGHARTKVEGWTRIYYVIEGEGTFILENNVFEAGKGDLFVIEDGEEYEYKGKMKLFEFNVAK